MTAPLASSPPTYGASLAGPDLVRTPEGVAGATAPIGMLLAFGAFAITLSHPMILAGLPLKYLLKDTLGVSPVRMALFFGLAGLAWHLKPLVGLAMDRWFRRLSQASVLSAAALVAAGGWALLAALPVVYPALLLVFMSLNLVLTVCSNVLGGMLVVQGNHRAATGRYNSAKMSARHVGYLIAGPLGGYLALRPLGYPAAIGAALLAVFALIVWTRRDTFASNPDAGRGLLSAFKSKPLWIAALMIFLVDAAPGFDTVLFYHQTDVLKFSPRFLGWLQLGSSLAGLASAGAYAILCRRFPSRFLLTLAVVLHSLASLFFLGYRSAESALAISCVAGFSATFALLPVLDLATRATPRAIAAGGFALMMSVRSITDAFSDNLGTWLHKSFGLAFHDLVWINGGATLLVLLAVPFVPAALASMRDGDPLPSAFASQTSEGASTR